MDGPICSGWPWEPGLQWLPTNGRMIRMNLSDEARRDRAEQRSFEEVILTWILWLLPGAKGL